MHHERIQRYKFDPLIDLIGYGENESWFCAQMTNSSASNTDIRLEQLVRYDEMVGRKESKDL